MTTVLTILIYIISIYAGFSVLYIFIFAVASLFRTKHKHFGQNKDFKCLVLIPAYKEDQVIIDVAEQAVKQNYPNDKYDVVVIADQLKKETLEKLRSFPIKVIEVFFEKSTKAKALNFALDQVPGPYDIAFVIDADNIMEPDFISKLNSAFAKGFQAVQGHRMAKNMNTPVARLDAISEEINNSIFRQGHRAMGVSSAFIGSGLAVKYDLFKSMMKNVTHVGEDKELEVFLLRDGHKIEYVPHAMVYDEKIAQYGNMVNQRRRWLFAQFDFFRQYIGDALKGLFSGKFDYFDKVIQQALIPRSLLIGLTALYFIIYGILALSGVPTAVMLPNFWIAIASTLVLALLFAIPRKFYSGKTLKALFYLPKGIIVMSLSLVKSFFSGNTFFHTKHGTDN